MNFALNMEEQNFSLGSFAEVWSTEPSVSKEKLCASAWLLQQPFPVPATTPPAPRLSNILHSLSVKPAKPSTTRS